MNSTIPQSKVLPSASAGCVMVLRKKLRIKKTPFKDRQVAIKPASHLRKSGQ
jgi:hypothetical protein